MVPIFRLCRRANGMSSGSRAIDPSSFITSQMTLAGISRSEEHTSELQSLMRISYSVFCLIRKMIPLCRLLSYLTSHHLYLSIYPSHYHHQESPHPTATHTITSRTPT